MRRIVSCFIVAAAAAALLATGATSVLAHAAYKDSNPKDGETVPSPPSEVWAEFTEPPAQGSYLQVFDACGTQVDNGDTELSGYRMTVSMSSDTAGKYVVHFRAISAVDSHETNGTFDFTSSSGPSCAGEEPPDEEPGAGGGTGGGSGGTGGGSGGTGGGSAAGSGGSDAGDAGPAEGGSGTTSGDAGAVSGRGGGKSGPGRKGDVTSAAAPQQQEAAAPETESGNVWEGIPMGSFFVALAIAAVIGAAGGRVYAGILGPRA